MDHLTPCADEVYTTVYTLVYTSPATLPSGRAPWPDFPAPAFWMVDQVGLSLAPYPGDRRSAFGAGAACCRQAIPEDGVSTPLNQCRPALVTAGMLILPHEAGKVARVHVFEPRGFPDGGGAEQDLRSGVVGVAHAVVLVERGNVPRDQRRGRRDKPGRGLKLVVRIVPARDDQRDHFQPEPPLVNHLNGLQHVLQLTTQRPIVRSVHGLEVHLVAVGPGAEVV